MIQSNTVESVSLTICNNLKKIILHCPNLASLDLRESLSIETVIIWSDSLDELDLRECNKLVQVDLDCPSCDPKMGKFAPVVRVRTTKHAAVSTLITADLREEKEEKDAMIEHFKQSAHGPTSVPQTFAC